MCALKMYRFLFNMQATICHRLVAIDKEQSGHKMPREAFVLEARSAVLDKCALRDLYFIKLTKAKNAAVDDEKMCQE